MKLIHLAGAMALAFGAASAASAQDAPPPGAPPQGGRPHGRMTHMSADQRAQMDAILFKGMTLTTDQKTKFEKLNVAQETEMKALFDSLGGRPADDAGRQRIRALREKQQKQFRAVLTKDQLPIYDKNVAELKAIMQQHMQARGNGGPPPQR